MSAASAHVEDPEARAFTGDLLHDVHDRRAELLAACLTIWRWGRLNEADIPAGRALGSFGTWSRWVRDPLLALGCRDPAERIAAAKQTDQRRQQVAEALATWWQHHGARHLIAAELNEQVTALLNPNARGRQFVSRQLQTLTGTRVGGYVLNAEPKSGRWSPTRYYVVCDSQDFSICCEEESHRGHRGHRGKASERPQKSADPDRFTDPYDSSYDPHDPPMPISGAPGAPYEPGLIGIGIGGVIGGRSDDRTQPKSAGYSRNSPMTPKTPMTFGLGVAPKNVGITHAADDDRGGEI